MEPIWLSVGRAFVGLKEHVGPGSNPVILQWVKDLEAPSWYDDDDKPWCALWLNRVALACQLPLSGSGYDLFRARSFAAWGREMPIPALGALMVFDRPEGAHVGFYLGERKDAYYVLGANQSNAVGLAWIQKKRLVATRWPADVDLPAVVARTWLDASGAVSTNEV